MLTILYITSVQEELDACTSSWVTQHTDWYHLAHCASWFGGSAEECQEISPRSERLRVEPRHRATTMEGEV